MADENLMECGEIVVNSDQLVALYNKLQEEGALVSTAYFNKEPLSLDDALSVLTLIESCKEDIEEWLPKGMKFRDEDGNEVHSAFVK